MGSWFCVAFSLLIAVSSHADTRIQFFNDASLSEEDARTAFAARAEIGKLLSTWSWKKGIEGHWQIHFVDSSRLVDLADDAETGVVPNGDEPPILVVAWDRIRALTHASVLTAFEHVAAHIYRMTRTKNAVSSDAVTAHQLAIEGVFLALSDVRRQADQLNLDPQLRNDIETDWRLHLQAAFPGASPREIERLECSTLLKHVGAQN